MNHKKTSGSTETRTRTKSSGAPTQAAFRPDPHAENELRYFFADPDRALSVAFGEEPVPEVSVLVGVGAIVLRLMALPEKFVETLGYHYAGLAVPPELERALGPLAVAVVLSPEVAACFTRSVAQRSTKAANIAEWLVELVSKHGDGAVEHWRRQAESAYVTAMTAYERLRRSTAVRDIFH